MNELMIVLAGGSWMYFKTRATSVDTAFTDFCETCDNIQLNIDNLEIIRMVLRDTDENDIEEKFY